MCRRDESVYKLISTVRPHKYYEFIAVARSEDRPQLLSQVITLELKHLKSTYDINAVLPLGYR